MLAHFERPFCDGICRGCLIIGVNDAANERGGYTITAAELAERVLDLWKKDRGVRHERVTPNEAAGGALAAALSFSEQKSWYLSPLIVNRRTLRGDALFTVPSIFGHFATSASMVHGGASQRCSIQNTSSPQPCEGRLVEGRSLSPQPRDR